MKNFILVLVIFILSSSTYCQTIYSYSSPRKIEDGWKVDNLHSLGYDTSIVNKLFSQLKEKEHEIHSVLLIKDEQILIEEYFKNQSVSTRHDIRSVTKSIRSILMGIAIEKGFIESIDDPISKYLKTHAPLKNLDPRKEQITIKHLLTMSSGLDCNDWDPKSKGQEDKVYKKSDWLQYTLNLPMINELGEVSNYCSMGVILVAEIISQASGMSIDRFAKKHLFQPLGVENVSWGHTSNKEVISSGKRLYMTSRDMAKIGLLVLNEGRWNGKQIISKEWINESTTPKTKITGMDYGYLWWNIPFVINNQKTIAKGATGNGGQYILILPAFDMVAVFTGGAYNSNEDKLPFAIMKDVILPTFSK